MNLSTQNLTELRDQVFSATESGELDTVKRLVDLFPTLTKEKVHSMTLPQFAARHGHAHILKHLLSLSPYTKDDIIDLLRHTSLDGHLEATAFLMLKLSAFFNPANLSDPVYQDLSSLLPDQCRPALHFPFIWTKVKGALFAYKKGKLAGMPMKKLAKFLY
jgi:hypothetical protein